ncbi:helix-hairpin-helix domain-containing protein [Pseudoalteromonas sp. NBT06-2]|uniref:helix-hairpin-helix domain-containing protein n=1 Tax=Pseudoalteromonas sp. NBT06-2 TaxID=2025950 RepID=UPI0020755280|nr:helix-hairpin-helix domain-containing protein [Pseudoalteromonas sp. NBT06-2]
MQNKKKTKNKLLTRAERKPKRVKTQQLYLIQGLPNVGPQLAKRLLTYFDSLENIFNATEVQLMEVEGVGLQTANKIKTLLTKKYS